ncbi:class I SAM-dependent methyltransferase [Rhizobium sp. RAF56]|uniref:class I SAM-dependent methyltransferase n=1 Tax=Rhizobium sp. RAF56 TaxID=3233062 RepID=UPI003F9506AD
MSQNTNPWNSDKPYDLGQTWASSQAYLRVINQRMTGDPDKHWLEYAIEHYLCVGDTKSTSCLLLGANEGRMEIMLRNSGFEGRIVATDIADKALERAKAKIDTLGLIGIEYVVADLNTDKFEPASFDFIIAEGVLHHIERLDNCIKGLKAALKPNGLLIGSEFIGAFRFQFPEMQVTWINAVLAILPRKYRPFLETDNPKSPADEAFRSRVYYVNPSVEAMIAMDPSEAVSGHLLMRSLRMHFNFELEKEAGGALIMNMVGHFPFDAANAEPQCREWLLAMADVERMLYEQKIVPSDLVFFVCSPKP